MPSVFAGARRRRLASRPYGNKRRARRALATKAYVKRAVNADHDKEDVNSITAAANASYDAAALIQLAGITALGIDVQRTYVRTIKVGQRFQAVASAGATFVRVIWFQWFQDTNNATPAAPTSILEGAAGATSVFQPYDMNNDTKVYFKILKDFRVRLGEAAAVEGSDAIVKTYNIKVKGLRKNKGTASGTGTGYVYCMILSDIANASSPPTVATNVRYSIQDVQK